MSSIPARPSASTARWRSDGPAATRMKRLSTGAIMATRGAKGLLSIQTLMAPGIWPSPNSAGLRASRMTPPLAMASRACAADSGWSSPVEGRAWARLRAMMRSKLGGLGGSPVMSSRTKASTVAGCRAGLKRRSNPMVEPGFEDIGRRTLAAEVRPANVAHEERVARQEEPRLFTAREVGHEQTDAVRRMSRGVDDLHPHRTEPDLVPVLDRRMGKRGLRRGMNVHPGSDLCGQALVARDMVGVDMGVHNVGQLQSLAPGPRRVVVDPVPCGVDHESLPRLAAADQVGDAAGIFIEDLLKDHRWHLPTRAHHDARWPWIRLLA